MDSLPVMDEPEFQTNNPEPNDSDDDGANEEMDALMDQYLDQMGSVAQSGQLLSVPIVTVHADHVLVDVGAKSEGMVSRTELAEASGITEPVVGQVIDVVVKGTDSATGLVILSHAEAREQVSFRDIEQAHENKTAITGKIVRAVKGGVIVNVGAEAFMPASQIDLRRVNDIESWVGREVECLVIEFMPRKSRIILSRRQLLEDALKIKREALFARLVEGQLIEATVKRVVDFGAFLDLDGIDGLVPRTEISWQRNCKPGECVKVGETLQVKVIEINHEGQKITLSRRQAMTDPWEACAEKFPEGADVEGEVVSLTSYGAFVRLSEGVDGMIHISDMSWDSGGRRPSDFVAVGQGVRVSVLKVDGETRRISLGLKQLSKDPWSDIEARYPRGSRIKGKVTGLTKFGAFVEIEPGIEGMIHVSDFSWEQRVEQPRDVVEKGQEIEASILAIDRNRRRISLGVKQLSASPIEEYSNSHRIGDHVEGEVTNVTDFGVFVKLAERIEGFIHVSQLDRSRVESPSAVFKKGDTVSAEITKIERDSGKISLSRRQMLKKEEKRLLKTYTKSSESGGANLGELIAGLSLDDDLPKE